MRDRFLNRFEHQTGGCRVQLHATAGGEELSLTYHLYEHSVSRKWLGLIKEVAARGAHPINSGDFYGSRFFSKRDLVAQMQRDLEVISNYFPEYTFAAVPNEGMSLLDLDRLHRNFEELAFIMESKSPHIPELQEAIDDLNFSIHRFESHFSKRDNAHVVLAFSPPTYLLLEDHEYRLFSLDWFFGHLYLSYGITGTAVVSAFYSRSTVPPRFQDVITEGMVVYIGEDNLFKEWASLDKWLMETHGWTRDQKGMSLGLIPLGHLVNCSENEKSLEVLAKGLAKFTTISIHDLQEQR